MIERKILLITVLYSLLILAGCGEGDTPVPSSTNNINTITGIVSAPPDAQFAKAQTGNIFTQIAAFFVKTLYADISGVAPLPGVTVELVQLDDLGNLQAVLDSTTTDNAGVYTFTGNPAPASNLVVRVSGQTDTMRAIVTGTEIDITPVSEVVFDAIIQVLSGSVPLLNFNIQEAAALNNLLYGMDIDVDGHDFNAAISAIQTASAPTLANLVTAYSTPDVTTLLHNNFYNSVDLSVTLEDPFTLAGTGGIELRSGNGGWGFGNSDFVNGGQIFYAVPLLHNLTEVSLNSVFSSFPSMNGLPHVVASNGQVIAGDYDINTVAGAVTASGSIMVYPLDVNAPGVLSRGIRIATQGSISSQADDILLDSSGSGTSYNLVRLTQKVSGPASSNGNAVSLITTTGTLIFNSTQIPLITDSNESFGTFSSTNINTDPLVLDIDNYNVSNGLPGSAPLSGFYNVTPGGSIVLLDANGFFLGTGNSNITDGEYVSFIESSGATAGASILEDDHAIAVAIRQPVTTPTVSGAYNAVQFGAYLGGDGITAAGTDNDGTLNVQATDQVTVSYNDAVTSSGGSATITATDSDGFIDITMSSEPGDTLTVTVSDDDLNSNPLLAETVSVTVVNNTHGESETIALIESGINNGVFVGTLATVFGTVAGTYNDSALTVQAGDTVTATYDDNSTTMGGMATITASGNIVATIVGSDGFIAITQNSTPGDALQVALYDPDLNTDTGSVQNIVIAIDNDVTGESESLTLTENGNNTGIFISNLPTVFGTSAGVNNDGALNVQAGHTFTATYFDALTAIGTSATRAASGNIGGISASGTIAITPDSTPGDTLTMSISDADLNVDSGSTQTFTISVVNDITAETELVLLTETGNNTGVFIGILPTVFGTSAGTNDDGTLNVQAGNTITVTYNDALTATGGSDVVTATGAVQTITGATGNTGTIAITPNIIAGTMLTVTVDDNDLNTDAGSVQFASVTVINNVNGEIESLQLTETGNNTGVFVGTLNTIFGAAAGPNNDATLTAQAGDTVTAAYNDALTSGGGVSIETATTNVGGANGLIALYFGNAQPGSTLRVTVEDADLNTDTGSVQTASVTVANDVTTETESLILTETGNNTGVFIGTLATVFGTTAGTNNDSSLSVQAGDTVTATYNDAMTRNGGTAIVIATDYIVGGIDGSVTITPNSIPGNILTVSVRDSDLNVNANSVEAISVTVVNDATGEIEILLLTETGTDTGVFVNTLDTAIAVAASVDTGYKYGEMLLNGNGTFNGGSLFSKRASMDVVIAQGQTSDSLTSLVSSTPELVNAGSSSYSLNVDGTMTLNLSVGNANITGSGIVSANGEFIAIAIRIVEVDKEGRGLLFLVKQH